MVNPANIRGTHFFLARHESLEAFWARYDLNQPSIEFRLAQLARAGVNYIRTWSSYRCYLEARYIGAGYGGLPQTNGHWNNVKHFCDTASEYDIGVALVLFNTFGFPPPTGSSFVTQIPGSPPYGNPVRPIQVNPQAGFVDVYLNRSILPDGTEVTGTHEKLTLWVGHPDVLDAIVLRDQSELFRRRTTTAESWVNGPNSGATMDFVHGYLETMNAAGVTQSQGLAEIQVFNEPEAMHKAPTYGVRWGEVCLRIFNHIGSGVSSLNPHSVPRHLAVKSPGSLALRDGNGNYPYDDAINSGFDDGSSSPPPVHFIDHFNLHTTADPYVAHNARPCVKATFDYARNQSGVVTVSFIGDLRDHDGLEGRGPSVTWKQPVAEETTSRAGTIQRATDLATYTVLNRNLLLDDRLGNVTWGHHTSDMAAVDLGAFILPCGFSLSGYETDAFNDNWRRDTNQLNPWPVPNVTEELDTDMSDAVQVAIAESTDGRVQMIVYAENYSPATSHSVDPNRSTYDRANKLYYRIRYRDGGGTWKWAPVLALPAAELDSSPGPLLFDESRNAVAIGSAQTTVVDSHYSDRAGYSVPSPAPPFGDYTLVEHIEHEDVPPPYLRVDALVRQKRRNPDCDLKPSVVFQRQAGSLYRFSVAWSRPVPKSAMNSGENYFPEQDSPAQRYFVPFKNSITMNGSQAEYWKYEVLLRSVLIDPDQASPIQNPGSIQVMRTRGKLAEATPPGNLGFMYSTPLVEGEAGASAIHPRLFADPSTGDMLLVYMKSQDSWFDINTVHPGGLSAGTIRAWEDSSAWHVYPWELFAMAYVERGTFGGAWVPASVGGSYEGDARVNDPYPNGGLAGWRDDTRIQLQYVENGQVVNNPRSFKRARAAEFFPAVDPYAVLWREGSNLRFTIAFKELISWLDTTNWDFPHGYETLVADFSVPVAASNATQTPLPTPTIKRLRVPFELFMPTDDGTFVPPNYASYDAKFDMNEAPIARTPDFGGLGVSVVSQHGQWVAMNNDGYDPVAQVERVITGWGSTGLSRIFSSSFQCASVVRSGADDDVFTSAWLYHKPAPGGDDVYPEVELWIWGRVGGLDASPQVYRVVTQNAHGADFQARVLSIVPAGLDGQNRQQFALTWQQSGRLLRLVYAIDKTPGGQLDFPTIQAGSATVVAGAGNMTGTGSETYLHSGRTKAEATRGGVVWACKGSVNFRGFLD